MSKAGTDFFSYFFTLTNQVKFYHWQTKNYARHLASDRLFNALLPLIDQFVEVYGGIDPKAIRTKGEVTLQNLKDEEMIPFLNGYTETLERLVNESGRYALSEALKNILIDILDQLYNGIYLFNFE